MGFPVKFAKFLKTTILTEHFQWLLLYFAEKANTRQQPEEIWTQKGSHSTNNCISENTWMVFPRKDLLIMLSIITMVKCMEKKRQYITSCDNNCIKYKPLHVFAHLYASHKGDKVFKNGASKICGRGFLKIFKWYSLLKQSISFQIF